MTLAVGQRFDVVEILPENDFAKIQGQCIKVGRQMLSRQTNLGDGIFIDTRFGPAYHYPVEGQLKKIGTLIITKVK